MGVQSVINCVLIALGAVVMLVSIVRYGRFAVLLKAAGDEQRLSFYWYFAIHRALMAFFLLGYVGAIVAIVMNYPLLSETFVSFIFLGGSVFVYLGIVIQLKLAAEIAGGDGSINGKLK